MNENMLEVFQHSYMRQLQDDSSPEFIAASLMFTAVLYQPFITNGFKALVAYLPDVKDYGEFLDTINDDLKSGNKETLELVQQCGSAPQTLSWIEKIIKSLRDALVLDTSPSASCMMDKFLIVKDILSSTYLESILSSKDSKYHELYESDKCKPEPFQQEGKWWIDFPISCSRFKKIADNSAIKTALLKMDSEKGPYDTEEEAQVCLNIILNEVKNTKDDPITKYFICKML